MAHLEDLRSEVADELGAWVDAVGRGWRTAELSRRELALCGYAEKLTRTPQAMSTDDVDALRAAGLSDRDVLDLAHVIGYFAYANRLADGLGCDLEDSMQAEH